MKPVNSDYNNTPKLYSTNMSHSQQISTFF